MDAQRWLRFLPGRTHLLLVAGLALVLLITVAFVDLRFTRNASVASFRQAEAGLVQGREQNTRLIWELKQAQQGQHILRRAWEYYSKAGGGTGIILRALEADPAR